MPTPKRRAGRLTRVEAARRAERVVEVAANMFLEQGFDATSMEAVAEKAGIAKPTLYAWYRDKAELFTAVLRRQIEHFLGPLGRQQHDLEGTDAESALTEIGRHVIAVAWSPGALAVRRIVTVQAERFPELERLAHEEGWLAAVKGVARVLVHYVERKEISVGDPELAADMFLNLVLGHAPKTMGRLLRYPRTREATEKRVQAAVRLFLEGVRVR
jgi:TetR/AcrR family transcriptional regulator, mexJK operon transcriptional repressor